MLQHAIGQAYERRHFGSRSENIESAITYYEKSLAVYNPDRTPIEWGYAMHNLGVAYNARVKGPRLDNKEKAIEYYRAALSVRSEKSTPHEWAETHNNLANALQERRFEAPEDNVDEALRSLRLASRVHDRKSHPSAWATIRLNTANAYARRRTGENATNQDAAIRIYRELIDFYTEPTANRGNAYNNLGATLERRTGGAKGSNIQEAIDCYVSAADIRRQLGDTAGWAESLTNLGRCLSRNQPLITPEQKASIIPNLLRALQVRTLDNSPTERLTTALALANAYMDDNNWSEAKTILDDATACFYAMFGLGLDERESRAAIARAGRLFSNLAYCAQKLADTKTLLDCLAEGRSIRLVSSMRIASMEVSQREGQRLQSLRLRYRELQDDLIYRKDLNRSAVLKERSKIILELEILTRNLVTPASGRGFPFDDLTRVMTGRDAIIAPVVSRNGGFLVIICKTDEAAELTSATRPLPNFTVEALKNIVEGEDDLEYGGWLGAYFAQDLPTSRRRTHEGTWMRAVSGVGGTIWNLIGSHIKTAIDELNKRRDCKIERLFWMPPDALGIMPIGLAQDVATGERLGEKYEISFIFNIQMLINGRLNAETSAESSYAAIINPTGDLPFSEIEGALVGRLFSEGGRSILIGDECRSNNVLAALRHKKYWHFACHANFEWLGRAGTKLVLAKGEGLGLRDIELADIGGSTRLAVLSACETGIYDIGTNTDEFEGLPNGFMSLGVQGVLCSLWKVDDVASALLAAKMFEGHLLDGRDPCRALQDAQAWLKNATVRECREFVINSLQSSSAVRKDLIGKFHRSLDVRARSAIAIPRSAGAGTKRTSVRGWYGSIVSWITGEDMKIFSHPYFWGGVIFVGS